MSRKVRIITTALLVLGISLTHAFHLFVEQAMCHYAGDDEYRKGDMDSAQSLMHICYESTSNFLIVLEVLIVGVISALCIYYLL
jgi:hypothetical protein